MKHPHTVFGKGNHETFAYCFCRNCSVAGSVERLYTPHRKPTPAGGSPGYNPNKVIPLPPTATPAIISPNSPLFECTPPALSVNSANGWCANYNSKTGGVTIK